MNGEFHGFTPDTYMFLMELQFQNNKPFYLENRQRYLESVREPMLALSGALMPTMLAIDPDFDPRPERALSRIYRDARRTHGVNPYRDHAWLAFKHAQEDKGDCFCMYFEIETDGYGYGMGSWCPTPAQMAGVRARILADPARFLALAQAPALAGFTVTGELYKRDRYPEAPEALKPYLNRKGLSWCYFNRDLKRTMDAAPFFAEVKSAMQNMAALYQFLTFCRG